MGSIQRIADSTIAKVLSLFFFLVIFKNNGFKGFLSITNQPCRIIEIDFKGSRSAIDFVVFCFDFTDGFINSPIFVNNNS